jgi:hypothetical protein
MPRALHDVEAWNEAMADAADTRRGRFAEKLRRAADLEHWAAFRESFERLGRLLASVARGEHAPDGRAPASVCVLSGDVHHAYVAEAEFGEAVTSPVYQLTCSPLHNYVPGVMKVAFKVAWSRSAEHFVRRLLRLRNRVPPLPLTWRRLCGPYFGNAIATLVLDERRAEVLLECSAPAGDPRELAEVARLTLAG